MSAAAPLSFASLSLEKNQQMPLQAKKKPAAAKQSAQTAEAAAASASPPAAKPAAAAAAAPAKKAAAPAAAKPAAAAAKKDTSSSPIPDIFDDTKERPVVAPRTHYSGFAMVKAVLSGDSLLLAGSAADPSAEKLISLTGVLAPKFGRGKKQEDEPFAWESREYLRKHVIGQQVHFVVHGSADKAGDKDAAADAGRESRHYGVVTLKGVDIATQMLKAGWVTVKLGREGKDGKQHPDKEDLLRIQEEAKSRGVGMFRKGVDPKDHLRTIDWAPDAQALYAANKNQPLHAVVDQVRDGSTLRVELVHPANPLKHTMVTLYLAGVASPRTPLPLSVLRQQHERKKAEDPNYKGKAPTKEDEPEPFALEAQQFTEARLLNRDVQVLLQGVDKSGNLFGSVQFAKGNISQRLLEFGLAKLVPWSAALTPEQAALKAAEQQAKQQKLRLWANWSPENEAAAASAASGSAQQQLAEFQGKVVSIASSDSLVVEDASGKEVRVWLASVRAPRVAPRGKPNAAAKDEPFAAEAKEFLRSKLIGHKVRVVPEYVRAAAADDDRAPRHFATIFQNKLNINEALIAAGYAEALQHRMDEERSQWYDVLLAAEAKAKEAKRGKWDPKEKVVHPVQDLTDRPRPRRKAPAAASAAAAKPKAVNEDGTEADAEEGEEEEAAAASAKSPPPPSKADEAATQRAKALSNRARQLLPLLQREKKADAVVEFVFSASRFKLLVPKENVLISFSLAGVRTPATRSVDGKPVDPLAEEILSYVRSRVQQHSVKIEVETMDKADNFLGSLFHNRSNLAVDLLQQGYASIFGFSAAKSPYSKELYAAERAAKDARRGIWKDWVEPTPEEKAAQGQFGDEYDEDAKEAAGSADRVARITEIVDCSDFFVQFIGDKNAAIIEKALADVAAQPESDEPFNIPESHPKSKPFIAAGQFGDDTWHRVRLDGVDANGDFQAYFIDFGNYDTLLNDRVRALPAEAQKLPPLAVHCALAGLAAPKSGDYQESSALSFSELAFGDDLKCTVEFTDKFGRKHVTLSRDANSPSVNRLLLRAGLAKVQARPDRRISRLLQELNEEQQVAKHQHLGVFEYGDVSDEDEERDQIRGPDPNARPKPGQKPLK